MNQKGFASFVILLLLLAGIVLGTYLIQQKTNLLPKASESDNSLNMNYLDEDSNSIGQKATSLEGTGVSAQFQIQQQGLSSSLSLEQRPNIVIIISDDQTYNQLSLAGNTVLKTPNIDSLANPGAYFKNAYVPEGICSPSRASIWTSKLPHVHGVYAVGMILPTDQITLPEILHANSYNTGFIGKCHLGDPNSVEEYTRGFDFRLINKLSGGRVPDWYNYQVTRNGVQETHTQYVTDFLTDEAIKFIDLKAADYKQNKKPFFLWLAQPAPHYPTIPPKGSNRYSIDQIQLPQSISDDLSTKPPLESAAMYHKNYLDLGSLGMKSKLKDSYEVLANMDDNVGRVNETLKNLGIKEDTVVIYLSDNGIMYGEHQIYQKGPYFYDEQVKSPLIFSYPKLINQSKTVSALTSTMDIMPTLLDLLKIPIPSNIQGKSFLNVLTGLQSSHRKSLYLEYPTQAGCMTYPMRGIIMNGFKWVQYLPGKYDPVGCATVNNSKGIANDGYDQELYDLNKDPNELNNLMRRLGPADNPLERLLIDPNYGKVVQKLRKERAIWATDTLDPSRFILTDGTVSSPDEASLEVSWKNAQGMPTLEVEYKEKNCPDCPILEYNDYSHTTQNHKATLGNLKPNTAYQIRAFSFGRNGVGGYIDLEGTTRGTTQQLLQPGSSVGCISDDQCGSGQVCQRACNLSFPPKCGFGSCVTKLDSSPSDSNTVSGFSSGSVPSR